MGTSAEEACLPRANVRRVVKAKLLELASAHFGEERRSTRELPIQKDALMALSESAKIFIHYLSATANDICREAKRQTLNANDVLKALQEIEFFEFTDPLKAVLEELRKENESKKAETKRRGAEKKRKVSAGSEGLQDGEDVKDGDSDIAQSNEMEQGDGEGSESDIG